MIGPLRNQSDCLLGGVEAGGTKFVCVVGSGPDDIRERATIPTSSPTETLNNVQKFFSEAMAEHGHLGAFGIGSFGPVELNRTDDNYGSILATTKPGWSSTNIVRFFADSFGVPVEIDTDVNCAAIGEHLSGAAMGLRNFAYVTVGTGIGVGVMVDGRVVHGAGHPEVGHMLIPHDSGRDPYRGCCSFHDDCLEGLASGPALRERWGIKGQNIPEAHAAWELQAYYMAVLCVNLSRCYAPEKIILGGGVMQQQQLFPLIRKKFRDLDNGYSSSDHLGEMNDFIVPPGLRGRSGEVGALVLARNALPVS